MYLLLRGVIRPEPSLIVRSLCRRIAYRIWQLIRKTGLEVALLGVDGTGKSSLAIALLRLPAAVKLVYESVVDIGARAEDTLEPAIHVGPVLAHHGGRLGAHEQAKVEAHGRLTPAATPSTQGASVSAPASRT